MKPVAVTFTGSPAVEPAGNGNTPIGVFCETSTNLTAAAPLTTSISFGAAATVAFSGVRSWPHCKTSVVPLLMMLLIV